MRLVWTCHSCGQPIKDRAGYLFMPRAEAMAVRRVWQEFEHRTAGQMVDGNDIPAIRNASWVTLHRTCITDEFDIPAPYIIEIERIRTVAQLLHWTYHLMGKTWLPYTNWRDLLESVAVTQLGLVGR